MHGKNDLWRLGESAFGPMPDLQDECGEPFFLVSPPDRQKLPLCCDNLAPGLIEKPPPKAGLVVQQPVQCLPGNAPNHARRASGLVGIREVKQVPREAWNYRRVGEILVPCSPETAVAPATDAVKALSIMRRTGNSRLLVVEGGRLVGIIALKDLLEFLGLKMDLERLE